ncbi:hypothetical protein BDW22DRAFT_1420545 [Trametopsis cervina]|nr:hypothetical protein BDW22DRAFT_1420545 [Trametopsis cervina]
MIILDEGEDRHPKIASPLPIHVRTHRPLTPTPSLPDYETSQEQLKEDLLKKKPLPKRLKWTLWGLGVYFVVTVAIGVPLLVVKTRDDKDSYKLSNMISWFGPNNNSAIPPSFFNNFNALSVCLEESAECNGWKETDKFDGKLYNAHLEYYVPLTQTTLVQSNVTICRKTSPVITGSLVVSPTSDPKDTRAKIIVDMAYSSPDIRQQTHVCRVALNETGISGLSIYVPFVVTPQEHLSFNISFQLPLPQAGKQSVYIPNFVTALPYFSQTVQSLSSQVVFGNVALGGYRSDVNIDSLQAETILLKSPFGGATGLFNITADDDDDDDGDMDGKTVCVPHQ